MLSISYFQCLVDMQSIISMLKLQCISLYTKGKIFTVNQCYFNHDNEKFHYHDNDSINLSLPLSHFSIITQH